MDKSYIKPRFVLIYVEEGYGEIKGETAYFNLCAGDVK